MWIELKTLLYQEKSQKFTKRRENLDTSLPAIQKQSIPLELFINQHGVKLRSNYLGTQNKT